MMTRVVPRSGRRAAGLIAVALAVLVVVAPAAWGATPSVDIHSAGPLSDIYIANDLSCQVRSGGFSSTEFFPNSSGPGDCGTFFNTGSDTADEELFGPDFANHAAGTNTTGKFPQADTPWTPVSQSVTGTGAAASPFQVTTVATGTDPFGSGGPPIVFQITEVDSYVVGNDFYRTDVTLKNISGVNQIAQGTLYHAADCQLRGSTTGFGIAEPPLAALQVGVACSLTSTATNSQPLERFSAITSGDNWVLSTPTTVWGDLNTSFPNGCTGCGTSADNATGIEWAVPGLAAGASQTFSWNTVLADTVPAGGFSFSGPVGSAVGGTVATISDPNTSATPSSYSATINWGDGTTSAGTITGANGSFNVNGTHAYSAGGSYPIAVAITSVGTNLGSSTVNDSAAITAPPSPVVTGAPSIGITGAAFTGSVNPDGLLTSASFQYALDPKYTGGGPLVYNHSTPAQSVGADFTAHAVTASVGGLVPNALYHVRLVASNSAGTSFGPDVAFTTLKAPLPGAPTVGKTFNLSPVSGVVLIKVGGQLVPLTQLKQIPKNTLIDALHGTLKLTTAVPGAPGGAHDAAATKGKKRRKVKTQSGTFGGAIFKISQARNGLATLNLVEGAVKGGPSFGRCKAHKAADATIAASGTLQLLHASAHGKFSTKGRYSAATVRGTRWTVADRCDGTLTHDITDSVAVTDFVHHKTIILHVGQSYLAKARQ